MARYDLHIHIIDPSEQTFGETMTFDLLSPILVDGLQALVNRWTKTFLTPKGSDPIDLARGTEFPFLIGSNIDETQSLQALLTEYVLDATEQVKASDRRTVGLPNTERLRDATIIQYTQIDPTRSEFWVEVTNAAYQRATTLIPYKVTA